MPGSRDGEPAPALRLAGLHKAFGDTPVLSGLHLDVPAGQKLALIGGSGSGKTTLLRLAAGLDTPDSGTIEAFGRLLPKRRIAGRLVPDDLRQDRDARRPIGMVFQAFNLFPHLTALQNIMEAPVHVARRPKPEAEADARRLLARVGLSASADKRPSQLSGGQQQRVAIARALAMRPKLMLFDEPTASLDPESVGEVLGTMRDLAEHEAVTMLIVTHEMAFAREVADRVIVMQQGKIAADGPPTEVLLRGRQAAAT